MVIKKKAEHATEEIKTEILKFMGSHGASLMASKIAIAKGILFQL